MRREGKRREERRGEERRRREGKRREEKGREEGKRQYLGCEEYTQFEGVPILNYERIKVTLLGKGIHVVSLIILFGPVVC